MLRRGHIQASVRASVVVLIALVCLLLIGGTIYSTAAQGSKESKPVRLHAETFAADAGEQSASYPNCRFGVGGNVNGYDVIALNAGWYLDWSTQLSPMRPNGAEYVQVVRLQPDLYNGYTFTPTTATLQLVMGQNPGTTWLIGNEPDSPFQDRLAPEQYARAYHQLYYLIKQYDPSGRVGVGGIVQPTPLRLQYLDMILDQYEQVYGERLPTDFWNIHSFILREIDASDPEAFPNGPYAVWGAYIPPGITVTRGVLYTYSDMFSTAIFRHRLLDFRAWMRDRGERDKPLVITEYGELFPYPPDIEPPPYQDENGEYMTEARVAAFMISTFDVLRNLADAAVGYPADENRLVQRWLWYSVSDTNFGGPLFDPNTHARRPLGNAFYSYTRAISPGVDLLAVRVVADPPVISDTGQLQTTTLQATISNIGNISIAQPISVAFYSGHPPAGTLIGTQAITSVLDGCAETAKTSVTWSNLAAGAHAMYVVVDPNDEIAETNSLNNQIVGMFLVARQRAYLPAVSNNQ